MSLSAFYQRLAVDSSDSNPFQLPFMTKELVLIAKPPKKLQNKNQLDECHIGFFVSIGFFNSYIRTNVAY